MSLALYRKYRPATFAEVKGQEHVTEPLRQALRNGRLHHAYLFSGPRGCGKTSSARILARSLNCVQGPTPDPCGECESCVALAPDGPGSIDVIEIDAASHGGVDDARSLRERAFFAPVNSRFKVYIIDEAHMVTREGFNALLKLVEEPPPHLKFVFATTEPEKVIGTIRSRTHHYPFRLLPPGTLRDLLEEILDSEKVPYEPAALPLVVRAGAGSARDSLSILDQLLAGADENGIAYTRAVSLLGYTDASLLDEVVDAFAAHDGAAVFESVDRVVEGGHDPRRFAADLLERFRDLVVLAAVPDALTKGLIDVPPDEVERMQNQASRLGPAELTRAAEVFHTGLTEMRGATAPRLLLELMCSRVLLPGASNDEGALLARLERLERRLAIGGVPAEPDPTPEAPHLANRPRSSGGPAAERPGPAAGRSGPAAERPGPVAERSGPAAAREALGARTDSAAQPSAAQPSAAASAAEASPRSAGAQGAGEPPRPRNEAPAHDNSPAATAASRDEGTPAASHGENTAAAPHGESATAAPRGEGAAAAAQGARGGGGARTTSTATGPRDGGDDWPAAARPGEPDAGADPGGASVASGRDAAGAAGGARTVADGADDGWPAAARPGGGSGPPPEEAPVGDDGWPEGATARPQTGAAGAAQAGAAQPAPAGGGGLDVTAVRRAWGDILESVKRKRRVAWMILIGDVQVAAVDDRVLTLAFAREGDMRGFTTSGSDAVLQQSLSDVLGVEWRVVAVPAGGGGSGGGGGGGGSAPGPRTPQGPPARQERGNAPSAAAASPDAVSAPVGEPDPRPGSPDEARGDAHGGQRGGPGAGPQGDAGTGARGGAGAGARGDADGGVPRADADAWGDPRGGTHGAPRGGARGGAHGDASAPPPPEPDPDPGPDEIDPLNDADADDEAAALTGMALIERELGGTIIQEIDHAAQ